ncbi:MAG: NYN domain-containing protein, partial [Myxococcota bacterium]|nr:NYN domain-containing protein [Myxococcota bacterium]
ESEALGGIAVFVDFENIVLGLKDGFRVEEVLRALNDRGEVMTRRAYADWGRYKRHQLQFLEAGISMVFLPSYGVSDKNRTDTAVCVDAMEILFTRPHIDTFVIVSGDSDFAVLARRLRDHGKRVVGISARNAASQILVQVCHEFIFYETLVGERLQGFAVEDAAGLVRRALTIVVDRMGTSFRAGALKDIMRKQDPTFSEKNYGASSFTRFLKSFSDLVKVESGGIVQVIADLDDPEPEPAGRRRPRRGGGRSKKNDSTQADTEVLTSGARAKVRTKAPATRPTRGSKTKSTKRPADDTLLDEPSPLKGSGSRGKKGGSKKPATRRLKKVSGNNDE